MKDGESPLWSELGCKLYGNVFIRFQNGAFCGMKGKANITLRYIIGK